MNPEITILTPRGRLDAAGVRPFETEMTDHLAAGRVHLLVDLTQVDYVSSVGMRMFLTVMRSAHRQGGALKLCGLHPHVLNVFKLAGFDRVLSIVATRAEAESAFLAKDD
jgi:anti-anti-sigma factor